MKKFSDYVIVEMAANKIDKDDAIFKSADHSTLRNSYYGVSDHFEDLVNILKKLSNDSKIAKQEYEILKKSLDIFNKSCLGRIL
jgi:hypothetical protein